MSLASAFPSCSKSKNKKTQQNQKQNKKPTKQSFLDLCEIPFTSLTCRI